MHFNQASLKHVEIEDLRLVVAYKRLSHKILIMYLHILNNIKGKKRNGNYCG